MQNKPAVPQRVPNVIKGTSANVIGGIRAFYLDGKRIVDLTPGEKLGFWKGIKGLDVTYSTHNYLHLPYKDDEWDAVCFDPAFVPIGGRNTDSVEAQAMMERYGLFDVPRTVAALETDMLRGLSEAIRVVQPGGYVIQKCQQAVVSGKLLDWPFVIKKCAATWRSVELYDEVFQLRGLGMQPLTRKTKDGAVVPRTFQRTQRVVSNWLVWRKLN